MLAIVAREGAEPVAIGSRLVEREQLCFGFHASRMGLGDRIVWVDMNDPGAEWPDLLVMQDARPIPRHPKPIAFGKEAGRVWYAPEMRFPHGASAGLHAALYRKRE
jgi:hypothetical protein